MRMLGDGRKKSPPRSASFRPRHNYCHGSENVSLLFHRVKCIFVPERRLPIIKALKPHLGAREFYRGVDARSAHQSSL